MKRNKPYLILLFFLLIYLFFPTNNSSIDGYAYAASIKYGEELFSPHHLLYNITGYLLIQLVHLFRWFPDVLAFMKGVNAVAAVLCLWLFYKILKELGREENESLLLVLICGSSFSIWRFATENEVYILPIVFSLLASLYFLRFTKEFKSNNLFLSGVFTAAACLYHQIHFFWWLGLLIGILAYHRRLKYVIMYVLPALIVPLGYLFAIVFEEHQSISFESITSFVFREFYTGGVDTSFELNNVILFCINFFRSFLQAHGIIFLMLSKNILFIMPAIIFIFFMVLILFPKGIIKFKRSSDNRLFINIHVLIILLQLLFALYSIGNAEFMVMIPFLFLILLSFYLTINKRALLFAGLAILIWNFSYGILPGFFLTISNNSMVTAYVNENTDDLFVLHEDVQVQNEIYYLNGRYALNIQKTPSVLKFKNRLVQEAKERIDSCLSEGGKVFTDCLERPKMINRASLVINSDTDINFFKDYCLIKVDSVDTFVGRVYLFEVSKYLY